MCLRWTRRIRWSASRRDGTASPRVPWPSRVPLRQSRQRGRPASLTARHTKAWAMSFRAARYVCAVLPVPEGGWCVVCTVCLCWVACTRGCVVCVVHGMCVLCCLHQRVGGGWCARHVCAALPVLEGAWCVLYTVPFFCCRGPVVTRQQGLTGQPIIAAGSPLPCEEVHDILTLLAASYAGTRTHSQPW